jgi:hypothetical protein
MLGRQALVAAAQSQVLRRRARTELRAYLFSRRVSVFVLCVSPE